MVEIKLGPRAIDLPYKLRLYGVTEAMFDELVDEDTKAELIDGVMVVHSPASLQHDDLSEFLRSLLRLYARKQNLGEVLGPDGLVHLATCRRFGPDAFFLRSGRISRPLPQEFQGTPDLVLEVLSPSNRDEDLNDKRPAYREAGVKEIWLVDPENQEVIVDRRRRKRYTVETVANGRLESEVLEGFWIDVAWLWSDPPPLETECLDQILGER
jgi:Uma2 family endonuclease